MPPMKTFGAVAALCAVAYMYLSRDGYDPKTVQGKRVLLTGASSGIGESMAYFYAKLGARLVLTARREALLQKVAAKCRELGATDVEIVAADMCKASDRAAIVKHTRRHLDGLDYLVLNHASIRNEWWLDNTTNQGNMSELRFDMDVNFMSYVDIASQAIDMLKSSGGAIGIVTSICGKMGSARVTSYSATKFALHGFFSSWRQELQHSGAGISITFAVLGPIATETGNAILRKSYPHLTFEGIGASPESTAEAIVRGVTTRQWEIYYDWTASLIVGLHKLMPCWFENIATRFLLS